MELRGSKHIIPLLKFSVVHIGLSSTWKFLSSLSGSLQDKKHVWTFHYLVSSYSEKGYVGFSNIIL